MDQYEDLVGLSKRFSDAQVLLPVLVAKRNFTSPGHASLT